VNTERLAGTEDAGPELDLDVDAVPAPGPARSRPATRRAHDDIPEIPEHRVKPALEAILMVVDEPLDHVSLAHAIAAPPRVVSAALVELAQEYTDTERGFELRKVGAGWRFYSREEFGPVVQRFVVDGQQARLTQAGLETLAVVAYRQPVSRSRVSAIRGVNVDGVMRTLVSRGLVEEAGVDRETGAHLYRTTAYFLERMGLTSIEQLPEIAPFLPEMAELEGEDELADLVDEVS
jgi:segregation and condensation protein B